MQTLAVDCGGTGIKAAVLSSSGKVIKELPYVKTPYPITPQKLISIIDKFQNNRIFFDYNKDNNLWYEYIVPLNNKSTVFNALKNKEMLIHHLGFYTNDLNKIKNKYINYFISCC